MNIQKVRERTLKEHYPTQKEIDKNREIFQKISNFIEEEYGLESHFAGSAGRETNRKGEKDIDVFVLFPEDTSRKELEEKGLKIGKEVFEEFSGDYHVEYAEHPYTKGRMSEHEVEIVPCYDTDPDNILSAVDRTPHHTEWVKENLDEDQRKDVVVLKSFLDAQGLYGSSLEIQGFSGYLCEILIAYYGSFEELISAAPDWEKENRIDFGDSDVQFPSDFVVVDPVDPERNVAAVMTSENYAKFIFKAFQLKKDPKYSMFTQRNDFSEFELKKELDRRADVLVLDFDRPDEVNDVLYPQMRKLRRLINKKLRKAGFRIYLSGEFVGERCRILLELDRHLPQNEVIEGPKVYHNKKHLEQFLSKYDFVFVRDERLCAKTEREFTDAQDLVKNFLDGEASKLEMRGVPGHLSSKIEEFKFVDPLSGNEKWLKYLYLMFNCESK